MKFQITAANETMMAIGRDSAALLLLNSIRTKVDEMIAMISKTVT